ncbi:hypothetical protein NRS6120_14355 [Bacillus subtilis]|nr:M20 family metallopeptidase [Bacillus subtilis]CAF1770851.1 Carboxypeptidase G2 [Bacillus subtilis]CAI6291148.1 hypothetical protein NRS6120_14355 [Bacillus subtilis]
MISSQVYEYISDHKADIIKMLKNLVSLESSSTDSDSLIKISKHMQDLIDSFLNEEAAIIGEPNHPIVHSVIGTGERNIMFLGHLDTVWPIGTLKSFPIEIIGDLIKGPGTFDMKAGIVQSLWSLKTLQHFSWPKDIKVHLLLTTDEETGSQYSRSVIEDIAKKCEFVFVFEPSEEHLGALKTARKGVGIYKILIKGKAAHAGVNFRKGHSAAVEAAHQILYLSKLTDFKKGITVNVGQIKAGTSANTVPEEACLSVDVRFETMAEGKKIDHKIKDINSINPNCKIKVSGGINRPPMELNERSKPLLEAVIQAGNDLGIKIEHVSTGGASDGNFTSGLGVPTLDGLGAVGEGAHANNERIFVSKMIERTSIVALALYNLTRQK